MFVISRRQIITPARFSPCFCAIYSKVENKRFNAFGCLSARLSCLLQLLLLPHPQPLLPCKQLRSLRLHYIQTFASSDISFHSAYILYSSFQVTAVYFLCSPAGRKGLRGVTLFANTLTRSIPIKKQKVRHPLCRRLHRSQRTHSATLHSVLPLLRTLCSTRRWLAPSFGRKPLRSLHPHPTLAQGCLTMLCLFTTRSCFS